MRAEHLTHEDIREKLTSLDWKDKSKEFAFNPSGEIFIEPVLREAIRKLNSGETSLKGLTPQEEERVINEPIRGSNF